MLREKPESIKIHTSSGSTAEPSHTKAVIPLIPPSTFLISKCTSQSKLHWKYIDRRVGHHLLLLVT